MSPPCSPSPSPRPRGARRGRRLLLGLGAGVLLGGCGLVGGAGISKVTSLRVTENFGYTQALTTTIGTDPGGLTALRLTRSRTSIRTAGARTNAVDGHPAGAHQAWTLYVNGIEATRRPAFTTLYQGDHVWWDLHSTLATPASPAVVGEYPEPFTNGSGGQRFPTVLTCASGLNAACRTAADALGQAKVKVSFQGLGTGSGSDSLAVLVGTFTQLEGVIADELLEGGPSQSGVFAQLPPHGDGSALQLDNPAGEAVRTLRGSFGLVAATEQSGLNEPVWLITGSDQAGVAAAARALNARTLRDHYAVAVRPDGETIPLPLDTTS